MKGLKSGGQTRYDVRYHFVFIPRYRKRVLDHKIAPRIEGMIKFACQVNDWELYEIAVEPDHVHLYMGVQPKFSPSAVMKIIKGGTSKKIMELFPDLDEVYWGENTTFWADGYMVKTVGTITDTVITNYIKQQGMK